MINTSKPAWSRHSLTAGFGEQGGTSGTFLVTTYFKVRIKIRRSLPPEGVIHSWAHFAVKEGSSGAI